MAIRTRAERARHQKEAADATAPPVSTGKTQEAKRISEDVSNMLDEIDAVLEENAEEFVKSYVQRGGE